jgi:hypothetical protein
MPVKKCPVCDWEFKDQGQAVKVGKETVTVCCADCAKAVRENPAKYAKAR